MVAASTSVSYSSVHQFDGNRSIIWRQPSSCSSCSASSSCGTKNGSRRYHHIEQRRQNHYRQKQLKNNSLINIPKTTSLITTTTNSIISSGNSSVKHCTFASTPTTIPTNTQTILLSTGGRRYKQQIKTQLASNDSHNQHKILKPCSSTHSQSSDSSNSSSIRIIDWRFSNLYFKTHYLLNILCI